MRRKPTIREPVRLAQSLFYVSLQSFSWFSNERSYQFRNLFVTALRPPFITCSVQLGKVKHRTETKLLSLASLTSNKYGVGGRQKVAFVSECVSRNVFSPCFPTSFNDFAQTPVRLQVISFKISRIFFSCAYGTVVMALAGQIKQNAQSDAPKKRTCESVWLTQCLFLMLFCIIFIRVPSKTQLFYTCYTLKPRFLLSNNKNKEPQKFNITQMNKITHMAVT